ncbi:hypothetical protein R5031_32440 (plasmid) [Pseudomonas aeruginosa]|uniref:hypothetical protein n=1 Tax=Pseudomonas TaxID=286 RepID=UPI000F7DB1DC|nr:hypothetical protein [Pseudomonas aeruginosa]RTB38848.1 hypothetical protein EJ655_17375 [Pseudomonas aeruginosa]RTB60259.1 hypothetical protein EJ640_02175 [Pseudomonas aeruginosa]RTB85447.1 hypothetical protein EJ641_13810 [Pseudomonas aeruginosa]WOU23216.1 hypothetical protein R5031_32440 [Pseudomonas aeruginosa]
MNKANECTCPSGDGSLVHPCPAHPAVEQAGGDERAAFELFVRKHCGMPAHIAVNWDAKFTNDAWAGWQARAALAQPSQSQYEASFEEWLANELEGEDGQPVPAAVCDITLARRAFNHWPKLEQPAKVGGVRFSAGVSSRLVVEAAQRLYEFESTPEKEAERPEVVAYADPVAFARFKERGHEGGVAGREWMWAEPTPGLVAMSRTDECERIVGALRFERQQMDRAFTACINERDAAMAEVEALRAELQSQRERNTELIFKLGSATNGWGRCEKERDAALARVADMKTMADNYCALLMDANAKLAELEKQEPVATVAKVPGEDWNGLHFYRDLQGMQPGTKLYAAPVAQAQQLHDLDKQCRDDVARALGLRPNQERGFAWSYLLASIKSCVKASGDSAQAQHSAGYAEARQCVNCRHIGINDAADYAACHDCRWTGPEPDEDKCPGCAGENCMAAACPECGGRYELVAEAKISTPAAQAGQMPQAWLDVQAERRRQITAEGWTPEHDDEHSHGQIARAAACYALAGSSAPNDGTAALLVSLAWPWDEQWWKPTTVRRDMVKACALALAEIERLDRAAPGKEGV